MNRAATVRERIVGGVISLRVDFMRHPIARKIGIRSFTVAASVNDDGHGMVDVRGRGVRSGWA